MRKLKQAGVQTYEQNHTYLREKEEELKKQMEEEEKNKEMAKAKAKEKKIKEVDPYAKRKEDENPFQVSSDL